MHFHEFWQRTPSRLSEYQLACPPAGPRGPASWRGHPQSVVKLLAAGSHTLIRRQRAECALCRAAGRVASACSRSLDAHGCPEGSRVVTEEEGEASRAQIVELDGHRLRPAADSGQTPPLAGHQLRPAVPSPEGVGLTQMAWPVRSRQSC